MSSSPTPTPTSQRWLVAADDRTGAFDVAGELASVVGPVAIRCANRLRLPDDLAALDAVVVDLGSRHLTGGDAAALAAAIPSATRTWVAHKIDSQLRGNWAAELVARHERTGLRVLLVPAWPALGRVCVDGVVFVNGVPVADGPAGADPRSPVWSSRPAEHLTAAGAHRVVTISGVAELNAWLSSPTTTATAAVPFAVCDASTDDDMTAIASLWAPHAATVLLSGPGGPIGAGARAIAGEAEGGECPPAPAPDFGTSWLILCGSLHPMARRQLAEFTRHVPDVPVIASDPIDDGATVEHDNAHAVASSLAQAAAGAPATTVVVIGGDTAAALIGDAPWTVWGTAGPGLPYGRFTDDTGPWVVTKAGGFGDDMTLVNLYRSFSGAPV